MKIELVDNAGDISQTDGGLVIVTTVNDDIVSEDNRLTILSYCFQCFISLFVKRSSFKMFAFCVLTCTYHKNKLNNVQLKLFVL